MGTKVYSRSRLIVLLLVAAFLALFLFGQVLVCSLAVDSSWCRLWPHLSMERIQGLVGSAGPWAVAVSLGLMILHSFVPFPAEFITITNGMVFGFAKGVVVTWVGANKSPPPRPNRRKERRSPGPPKKRMRLPRLNRKPSPVWPQSLV